MHLMNLEFRDIILYRYLLIYYTIIIENTKLKYIFVVQKKIAFISPSIKEVTSYAYDYSHIIFERNK